MTKAAVIGRNDGQRQKTASLALVVIDHESSRTLRRRRRAPAAFAPTPFTGSPPCFYFFILLRVSAVRELLIDLYANSQGDSFPQPRILPHSCAALKT
eukprot:670753-Pleurochrysis_carterae.AAC.2